jgi:hypothetical protein
MLNTSYIKDNALVAGATPGPKSRAGERPDGGGCTDQAHL